MVKDDCCVPKISLRLFKNVHIQKKWPGEIAGPLYKIDIN